MKPQVLCLLSSAGIDRSDPSLAFALSLSFIASTANAQELVVPPDGLVEGSINGQTVAWRIQADGANAPVVNPDTARRIGLKTGAIGIGAKVLVGSQPVSGKTGVFHYAVGGLDNKRRGAWFERAITSSGDGMLGPGALVQQVVTFQLRPTQIGETVLRFPLEDRGYAGMGLRFGELFVQFDPTSDRTVATASAAAALAATHAGLFVGQPSTRAMRFGITRPVRTLRLGEPLSLAGLPVATLEARLRDYGNTTGIPDENGDPEEIVVTAKSKSARNNIQTLHLGRDALSRCSKITFDKSQKQILLSCE